MSRFLILAGIFTAAGLPAFAQTSPPSVVTNPTWISVQQPAYPAQARSNYVATGYVRLQCVARAGGGVDACDILEETPSGQGFGQEALNVMPRSRIRPRTVDGRPVDSRVIQSFQFALRDATPVSTQSAPDAPER